MYLTYLIRVLAYLARVFTDMGAIMWRTRGTCQ